MNKKEMNNSAFCEKPPAHGTVIQTENTKLHTKLYKTLPGVEGLGMVQIKGWQGQGGLMTI